jgi:ATP-dependent DNA helicase DinG
VKAAARLSAEALRQVREAISEASGNEVLMIGRQGEDGQVAAVTVGARGDAQAVPALQPHLGRGDVVIHNHPSGALSPSSADLQVASRLGNQGIGFYIVDNEALNLYAVAEPVSLRPLSPLGESELASLLEPGGPLSRLYEGYEERRSQVAMLRFVCGAFNHSELRAAEAGTGVGKSLAYLVPAFAWVLSNEERVVVSTATINLQQQLVEKDIPLVARVMGRDPGCYLVKGRGNYLCLARLQEALEELSLFEEQDEQLKAIAQWSAVTPTGSRTDLSFYPGEELWSRVCSEADACRGLRCPRREGCFVLKARREAAAARLLVANHHLLFSDLSMRLSGLGFEGSAVLPAFQRIVFDEAHNIEKNATSYFSTSFSRFQVAKYAGRLYREKRNRRAGLLLGLERLLGRGERIRGIRRTVAALSDRAALLDAAARELLGEQGGFRLGPRNPDPRLGHLLFAPLQELIDAILSLQAQIEGLLGGLGEEAEQNLFVFETRLQLRRLAQVAETCQRFLRYQENREDIHWLESKRSFQGEPYARLVITPLEVATMMRQAVFEPYQSVVFTSATLTVDGRFDYWKGRLGLNRVRSRDSAEEIFPSPFDYENNVFLGVPADAPEPDREGFSEFVGTFVEQAVLASEGRALVLFTSYELLRKTYDRLQPRMSAAGIPLMRQGEEDRGRLLGRFRDEIASVLLATDSFWEGVDAPGRALEVVIVTRLPFRVPSDPVMQARMEAIEERGGQAFSELSLPDAIIRLRQGFGRLMRRQDDRGAVLILDSRVVRRRYGGSFLASLPKAHTVVGSSREVLDAFESFMVSIRKK